MKLFLSLPILTLLAAGPVHAMTGVFTAPDTEAGHSGGCRKDSPKGQCCHAGSKPYHCH